MAHRRSTAIVAAAVLLGFAGASPAQVRRLAEMNTEEIRSLDRAKTAVLIPGGILEEHGPYLPCFNDGYWNEWLTRRLAEAIVARPGWTALVFPTIPLGTGGANEIGRRYAFPGTYAVRSSTQRAVFMDLLMELGDQGFKRGFIIHGHGAPNHNRMLHQVSDFFHDTYGGEMVHLMGLALPIQPDPLTAAEQAEDGFSVHAGAIETSGSLFVRPDLVNPAYTKAPPQTGKSWDDLVRLARAPAWPGYFGSPRLATAARGSGQAYVSGLIDYALKILDGLDPRKFRTPEDTVRSQNPVNVAIDEDALAREREIRRRQEEWLKSKGLQQ